MKSYGNEYLTSTELRSLGCASVGEDVRVHSTCVLVGLENLTFGHHVRVDPFCSLIAGAGHIQVGNHVHISAYNFMSGGAGIELADFVGISHGVRIYTRNDDYTGQALTGPTIPEKYLKLDAGPVRIGRHVVVGAGSIVLPAVEIAEGSIVGALSLVKSNLGPWGMYAGIPVRRLRDRSRALLEFEHRLALEESDPKSVTIPSSTR